MITRRLIPLAAARPLIILFVAVCVDFPAMQAQTPGPLLDHISNSIYSAIDLNQAVPARTGIHPQLQTSSNQDGLASLDPETRGDLLMTRQQYLAAVDAYRQASHNSPVVWNKLGIAYQHMYALDFAKLQYEKVDGPRILGVQAFDRSASTVRLQVRTAPTRQDEVSRELRRRVQTEFQRQGIPLSSVQRLELASASPSPQATLKPDAG